MNKIKQIQEFEVSENKKILTKVETYDENKNLLSRIYYDDNEISGKEVRTFNDKDEIIRYDEYDNGVDLNLSSSFEYAENGKLILEEKTFAHAGDYKSFERYNYENNLETIEISDEDGEFEGKIITKFNDAGEIIEKEVFNEFNELDEHFKNEYNSDNKLIKTTNLPTANDNYSQRVFIYNSENLLSEEIVQNKKGKEQQKILRFYDDKKQHTSIKIKDSVNRQTAEYKFEYEKNKTELSIYENGVLVKKEINITDNNDLDIKYIEQSDFVNDKAQTEIVKVFEYDFFE